MNKKELLRIVRDWTWVAMLAVGLLGCVSCLSQEAQAGSNLPTVIEVSLEKVRSGDEHCSIRTIPYIDSGLVYYFESGELATENGNAISDQSCDELGKLNDLGVNSGGKMNEFGCMANGVDFTCESEK